MESIRGNTAWFDGSDEDIWARAKSLAPTSAPVRAQLFAKSRVDPAPTQHRETGSADVRDHTGSENADQVRPVPWEKLPLAVPDTQARQSDPRFAAIRNRSKAVSMAFDLLRTRLLQTLQANNWTSVAITSPSPRCGSTFVATNLALSLSRLASCQTALVDLNFRAPGLAGSMGLIPRSDLRRYLIGELPVASGLVRYNANLALGLAGAPEMASTELLLDPRTTKTLTDLEAALKPDVILYDLPPMLAYDDVTAFLPHVDGVLLVADGTQTVAAQVAECERMIGDRTKLLGVLLNKARDAVGTDLRYGDG